MPTGARRNEAWLVLHATKGGNVPCAKDESSASDGFRVGRSGPHSTAAAKPSRTEAQPRRVLFHSSGPLPRVL